HSTVWLTSQTYRADTRDVDSAAFMKGALGFFHAEREAEQELHTTAAHLASHYELDGPNYTCLTACAAATQALPEPPHSLPPRRRRRPQARRRGAQHDPSVRCDRLQPADGALDAQRRAAEGVEAVRPDAGRLRAGRGLRHGRPGGTRARQKTRRPHLC